MDKILIVGLGNYPKEYDNTRHNVGFSLIDELSKLLDIPLTSTKFNGTFGYKNINDKTVYLAKPHTLMNLSGEFVRPMMDYFDIELDNLLVICDDVDTSFGSFRMRKSGSSGGQNGLKDIIRHLNSEDFKRIRIGIGRPTNGMSMVDHVLSKFNHTDRENLQKTNEFIAKIIKEWVDGTNFDKLMSKYNKK